MRLRTRAGRPSTQGRILLLLAAVLVAGPATPARDVEIASDSPADGPAWKAVAASGKVEARSNRQETPAWHKVRRGDGLLPGIEEAGRHAG